MRCKNNTWKAKQKKAGPGGPPCEDNPALEADGTCSALKGDCLQFTEKGAEMDRDCPGTCGSCDNCKCQDSSQWNQYCSFWTNFCASPGVLGTWMTTNCRKTCGHCSCKCCSYNGKQHSLGARIPIADKCGELVCQEGLVAGSSPLLPGAAQHPVSHPEELTLTFLSLHAGHDCCILPINAVGDNGAKLVNGTMVAEGWKGNINTENGSIALTCCHGSLQVPFEDAMMIPATSTTTDSITTTTITTTTTTTTTTTSTTTTTTTSTTTTTPTTPTITTMKRQLYSSGGLSYFKMPVSYGTRLIEGAVADTCDAAGMKSVCLGQSGCQYNSARCQVTPMSTISNCGNPMRGLSMKICGHTSTWRCSLIDGMFTYMKSWSGGEYGFVDGVGGKQGKDLVSTSGTIYYAYCVVNT